MSAHRRERASLRRRALRRRLGHASPSYSRAVASVPTDAVVGRQHERELARQLVKGVVGGKAAVLLIEGEAGVGKTRLVQQVREDAVALGARVLWGCGHPLERTRPFGVIAVALDLRPSSSDPRRAALGRLLRGEGGGLDPRAVAPAPDVRFRVVDEVVEVMETVAASVPVVLIVEDLHWADESSLVAASAIVHQLHDMPLLFVATLRPAPRARELDVLLDDWVAAGAHQIELLGLGAEEVGQLVLAVLGARPGPILASIVDKAAGNPLWIVELLRSLTSEGWLRRCGVLVEAAADELPGTFRELVLRRLHYLPAGALDVLQLGAVLGESISVHHLSVVSRRSPPEVVGDLAEAFRARLLEERGGAVVFRHQLVQQAIYEDIPMPLRRALHRDAAGALARAGGDHAQVASHLLRGADKGDLEAVRWLRRAAMEAAAGAPVVAVDLLERAVELLPDGHGDADIVRADLAEALLRAGHVADAATVAEAILDRPHREDADVRLTLTLVSALSLQNRATELIRRAEAALKAPALRTGDQALVLAQASYAQTFSGDVAGGEATARRSLALAELAEDAAMTVWSLSALSVAVKTQGRCGEALSMTRRAVASAFEAPDNGARLRHPYFFLGMALADCDLVDDARRAFERAIVECETLGSVWLLPDTLLQAAQLRFVTAAWDDATAELEAGLRLAEDRGQRVLVAQSRACLAIIAAARGKLPAAKAALEGLEAIVTDDRPPYGAEMVAFAMATIAEAEGDQSGAFAMLLRFWNHDVEREIRYYHRYLAPPLVRLALEREHSDIAADVVRTVEEGAALATEVPAAKATALRCRGLLDRDPQPLVEAVLLARGGRRLLDHSGACEDAAAVLATEQPDRAKDLLLEAQASYDAVDAVAWSARTAAALRRLGVRQGARRPHRRGETGWESLTTSERAVSELVAEGLTNREVARRLHISPHTVNTHLRHIFQKLIVTTRAELASKIARDGQITHSSDVSTAEMAHPDLQDTL